MQRFFVPHVRFVPLVWSVLPALYKTLATGRISFHTSYFKHKSSYSYSLRYYGIIAHSTIMSEDGCSFVIQASAFAASYLLQQRGKPQKKSCKGRVSIRRARRSVREIYNILGADYFCRVYRMSYESFWRLHSMLATRINTACLTARCYVPKGGRKGGRYKSPPIRNVCIWHVRCEFLQGAPCMTS